MKEMINSLEVDNEIELNKIKKQINFLVLKLKKKSIEYFNDNFNEFLIEIENEFLRKISKIG